VAVERVMDNFSGRYHVPNESLGRKNSW
jgi:hypothetical protein